MLHIWLIPALLILLVALAGFYLFIKYRGGSGERTGGVTIVDKPDEEDELPPG